ncbi:MAG: hypothetical protein OXB96_02680 [Candidatus Kaiserbacteria bacterium]|nr:hypothetical protein [Candidatus Kaiserbacteria bacterium]
MYFVPHNITTDEHTETKKGGIISDALVLLVTILLLVVAVSFPLWNVAAETRITDNQLVISIANKDYSVLLSSLFGKVRKRVPEGAHNYIRDIDEYRARIAQGVKENNELTKILHALIEHFPEKLKSGYQEEINHHEVEAERLKIAIFPYIENDATLSYAVVEKYNLYTSFTEWLLHHINKSSVVGDLNEIQGQSYALRKEIALLYIKINSVTQDGR